VLGVIGKQIPQQETTALHVAGRLLDESHKSGVEAASEQAHVARILPGDIGLRRRPILDDW
jgi:hypothetical protein